MIDALLFGEAMALFVADDLGELEEVENYTRTVSGAEVNVAIGLSRLGFEVEYLTRLGDDELGRFIKKFLDHEGINTSKIEFDPTYRTGIQLKSKVLEGDAAAPYFRKDSAATKIDKSVLSKIDWNALRLVHITGIPLALSKKFRELIFEVIEKAKEYNVLITFDPNIRYSLWSSYEDIKSTIMSVAKLCDVFLPGIEEARFLSDKQDKDQIFDMLEDFGIKKIIMKLGPEGSYVLNQGRRDLVRGYKVDKVIDTVGAGDGFAAGVLSALLDGLDLFEAADRGNAIGALQVTHWSDNQGLPNRAELESFMKDKK